MVRSVHIYFIRYFLPWLLGSVTYKIEHPNELYSRRKKNKSSFQWSRQVQQLYWQGYCISNESSLLFKYEYECFPRKMLWCGHLVQSKNVRLLHIKWKTIMCTLLIHKKWIRCVHKYKNQTSIIIVLHIKSMVTKCTHIILISSIILVVGIINVCE